MRTIDADELRKVQGGHGNGYQFPNPGILHGGSMPGEGSAE
jgi:hypothetical protein